LSKNTYTPLVSIVCMCFNHEKYVIESLESIKKQTYQNIEILINDDFSSDNSVSTIKEWLEYNKVAYVNFNKKNIGNTKSFNNSVKKAKGEYLIDLAADDILFPDAVENHIENFRKNNFKKGVSFGNAEYVDINDNLLGFHFPIKSNKKVQEKPLEGDIYLKMLGEYYINSCTMMVCNKLFDELEGYDESLWYEDLDFILRASRKYPFYFIDSFIIRKKELKSSLGSQFMGFNEHTYRLEKSTFKIFKKVLKMNVSKSENIALSNRVNDEIKINIKNRSYFMALKNMILFLRLKFFS